MNSIRKNTGKTEKMHRSTVISSHVHPRRPPRRVGIIGYGKVGSFLVKRILEEQQKADPVMVLAFVCDLANPSCVHRSKEIPDACKAETLENYFEKFHADLVVEVSHPDVSAKYGEMILQYSDYLIASTTAFADAETESSLRRAAATNPSGRGIYLTVGALFGASDIKKMSDGQQLKSLEVTMAKHPLSLFPERGTTEYDANEKAKSEKGPVVLYKGPIRQLARICPRNVNTLCTAALAALKTTGMDGTIGVLIADSSLKDMIIQVKAEGPPKADGGPGLRINVTRQNPSEPGEVTGMATFHSFYGSLLKVASFPPAGHGVHLA